MRCNRIKNKDDIINIAFFFLHDNRSYAVNDCKKMFWDVFGAHLEDASSVVGEQVFVYVLRSSS